MKLHLKKHSLLLLSALLLLASCGNDSTDGGKTQTDSEKSANDISDTVADTVDSLIPDFNGDGRDIHILGKDCGAHSDFDVIATESCADVLEDSYYQRNRIVEDNLNINIVGELLPGSNDSYAYTMYNELSKRSMAGENTFDILYAHIEDSALLARDGLLLDLTEYDGLRLDQPWWSEQFTKDVSIGDKVYYADGDICNTYFRSAYCVLFNKTVVNNYDYADPYKLVEDGKWTIETMRRMAVEFGEEITGDGKYMSDDRIGVGVYHNHVLPFFSGCGGKFVEYSDAQGFTFVGNNDRNLRALDAILDLYTSEFACLNYAESANQAQGLGMKIESFSDFGANRMLFLCGTMNNIVDLRSMEGDFGILPFPKLDEAQENYYTYVQTFAASCASIMNTAPDPETSAIVMDELARIARETITPAYYEKTLKGKHARDTESEAMLDIIAATATVDIGNVINVGDMPNRLQTRINQGKGDFASTIEKRMSKIGDELTELTDLYTGE